MKSSITIKAIPDANYKVGKILQAYEYPFELMPGNMFVVEENIFPAVLSVIPPYLIAFASQSNCRFNDDITEYYAGIKYAFTRLHKYLVQDIGFDNWDDKIQYIDKLCLNYIGEITAWEIQKKLYEDADKEEHK